MAADGASTRLRYLARPAVWWLLAVMLAHAPPVHAGEAAYARVTASIAHGHAIPRYRALSKAAAGFAAAATGFCGSAPPRDPAAVRAAFHAALDRWMAVEHIHHGPVEFYMRNFRLYFWPDRRSRGARQLRMLLQGRDRAVLAPGKFASASVAVQGFPAAARILFGKDTARKLVSGADGDYPCSLLAAIGRNIADIAAGMASNWTDGPDAFLNELRRAGGADTRFASHKEAAAAFVKGMYTALQTMTDLKLDRVLGKSIGAARPHRAESWRSGRSLRNLIVNLEALQALYQGENGEGLRNLLGPADAALDAAMSKAFRQALATARAIRHPLAQAVTDPAARPAVERLAKEIRALKDLVSDRLVPAFGTPLGFNARDGD